MLDSVTVLGSNEPLRQLLEQYARLRGEQFDSEWHDRVMVLDGVEPAPLSRLHGLLLANGWIETRVWPNAHATAGRLADCYRITREGLAVLRLGNANDVAVAPAPFAPSGQK